jgi:hypothetical protein
MTLTKVSIGQGCSDAGFCTISSIKPSSDDSTETMNNQMKVGIFLGNADHGISAYGNYFEYNRLINDKLGFGVKLTTIGQTGNDISVFGVSDLFLNAKYAVNKQFKLILGAKIPFSLANKSLNNLPLPMDYQPSLGTFDLIFGMGHKIGGFQLVAAIQQPLTQNDNQFFSSSYPIYSELRKFQSTNKFKRSGDVLLRISYPITLKDKFKFTPSLLPIYHLSEDKYTDELNIEREIAGSQGLTLNANLYLDYEINETSVLQLNVGFPFIVRESRPDGLTRSSIATLEYKIRF